ncbi:LysR family transcriptional regulator [Sphingomonas sp. OTU376]|uniref:LysR family transcriptional regulator n=1 Tax=Sphingomonas sp. OTU376 TaxID=3043863 RepID=UPI00313B98FE
MPGRGVNRYAELKVFTTVVEQGGFSEAAKALGLSPSAISRSIARLEARLGVPLFVRTTRRNELTVESEYFYRRVVRILGEIDAVERRIASGDLSGQG